MGGSAAVCPTGRSDWSDRQSDVAWVAPQTPYLDLGPLRGRGRGWAGEEEGKGREGEVEGRGREVPKLLLNQGPSEPSHATDCYFQK